MPMTLTSLITYFSGGNSLSERHIHVIGQGVLPAYVSMLTRSFISGL